MSIPSGPRKPDEARWRAEAKTPAPEIPLVRYHEMGVYHTMVNGIMSPKCVCGVPVYDWDIWLQDLV